MQAADELAKIGFMSVLPLNKWESALVAKGDAKIVVSAMPAKV